LDWATNPATDEHGSTQPRKNTDEHGLFGQLRMNLLWFLMLMAFALQPTQMAGHANNVLRNADASEGMRESAARGIAARWVTDDRIRVTPVTYPVKRPPR